MNHPDIPLRNGMTASEWSVQWWKVRHEKGYFPGMEWHKDWKVCPYPPPHVLDVLKPKPTDIVLEIGCGYGEWMVPLALSGQVGSVCGIDVHETLKSKANETFYKGGLLVNGKCEFRLTDGMSIPYESEKFDQIYSISVFQHIPRRTVYAYLAESYRVLKSGGGFLFHFRHADGKGEYSEDITVDHKGDFSTGWTTIEAQQECRIAGLKVNGIMTDANHSLFVHGVKP